MTPEQAHAINAAYQHHVTRNIQPPNTPQAFYWQERFGPKPTSEELWRKVFQHTTARQTTTPPASLTPVTNPYR